MKVQAVRCNGGGNKFILIDLMRSDETLAKRSLMGLFELFEKKQPLDGIILLSACATADAYMQVCNPDGNLTPMCINGIRCAGKYLLEMPGVLQKESVLVKTDAGTFELLRDDSIHNVTSVIVKNLFPIEVHGEPSVIKELSNHASFLDVRVFTPYLIHKTEIINEQHLIQLGETANSNTDLFPIGMNISMVKTLNRDSIYVRTYERGGIGLSDSCASSMIASAFAMSLFGFLDFGREVTVYSRGGAIKCCCSKEKQKADMSGTVLFDYDCTIMFDEDIKIVDMQMGSKLNKIAYDEWVLHTRKLCCESDFVI